jgi:hypothetical protein
MAKFKEKNWTGNHKSNRFNPVCLVPDRVTFARMTVNGSILTHGETRLLLVISAVKRGDFGTDLIDF